MNDDADITDAFNQQPLDMGHEQHLGTTIVPDINHPGGGFIGYEGANPIFTLHTSNMTPGGFDVHRLGSSGLDAADMGSVLDSFNFNPNEVGHLGAPTPVHEINGVVGTPDIDQAYWEHQTTGFTCAVEAQRGIIEEFTGQHISEAELTYEATSHGWLTNHGMSPADAGNLMELHGIHCHSKTGATVEDLMAELAQGHKVIVGVDSGKIWHDQSPLKEFFHHSADHAIWVTGVDMTDPSHPKIIVNDSGKTDGAGNTYDLHTFAKAWHDSGFFYVATNRTPPDMSLAAGHGFDTNKGVFPELVSYFGHFYDDFPNHLQDRLQDQTQITPAETPALFTDAAVRSFIENLPKSPMASFNESTTDTLFRII